MSDITIEPIEDREDGLSARTKINKALAASSRAWAQHPDNNVYNVLDYISEQVQTIDEVGRVLARNEFQDELVVTAGVQAAVDAAVAANKDFLIYFPSGTYVLNPIDFTAVNSARHYGVVGDGGMTTIFQVGPDTVQSDKLLNFDNANLTTKSKLTLKGFRIRGKSEYRNPGDRDTDPIGIYAPFIGTNSSFSDLTAVNLGNILMWMEDVDNSDFFDFDFSGCGWQKTEKTLGGVYASGDSGSTALAAFGTNGTTPAAGTFTGMVGFNVAIADASGGNDHIVREIATVPGDGSDCTLTEPLPEAVNVGDARKITYLPTRGSIDSGSTTLTMTTDVLTSADVGRPIWVDGATGANGGLQTTITAVDGVTVTVADAATVTVTDAVVCGGATWVISRPQSDRGGGGVTNDVGIIGARIEAFNGRGMIIENATRVFVNQTKLHARQATNNNFANSMEQMHLDNVNGAFDIKFDRFFAHESAHVVVVGSSPKLRITGSATRYPADQHLIYLNTTGTRPSLAVGLHYVDTDGTQNPVRLGAGTNSSMVRQIGSSPNYRTENAISSNSYVQMGQTFEAAAFNSFAEISLGIGEVFAFDPRLDYGVITVACAAAGSSGIASYRTDADDTSRIATLSGEANFATADVAKAAGDVVVTDGVDGSLTLCTTDDDEMILINRRTFATSAILSLTGAPISGS